MLKLIERDIAARGWGYRTLEENLRAMRFERSMRERGQRLSPPSSTMSTRRPGSPMCSAESRRAVAGLGGVGGDVLDAELVQGAPDLAAPPLVHLAAGLGRVEVVAAAVGIQRAGQAVLGEHRLERPEGGRGALLLDQEGRVDLRGGVFQGDDQVERRPARQPRMTRAVPRLRGGRL